MPGGWDQPDTDASAGELVVSGNAASGAADSGNPVKVGGVNRATLPTLTDGQRGDIQLNTKGQIEIAAGGSAFLDGAANPNGMLDTIGTNRSLATGPLAYNGATWDRVRTPNKFFTATTAAAGSLAVWTPSAGKKFRLMAYMIEVTANASLAAGAVNILSWLDAAAAIGLTHSDFEPTAAVTTGEVGYTTGWIQLGNGYLSSTINNVLNLSVGTALATGALRVNAIGTEE